MKSGPNLGHEILQKYRAEWKAALIWWNQLEKQLC